jgi:uncharacterized protein (DUF2062 family)
MARGSKRSLLGRLLAPMRLNWYRAVRSAEGSRYLAGGLGLGVFIAAFPLSFLHFPITWVLAELCRVSKSAATAGVMISNPLTIVPIFVFTTWVGLMVTPGSEQSVMLDPFMAAEDPDLMSKLGWSDLSIVLIGATTVGVVFGALTYAFAVRWIAGRAARRASYRRVSPVGGSESGHG